MKALLALLLTLAAPAMAEVRAVLVGVGDYLAIEADLRGPGADVALMAEVLVGRDVLPEDIAVLTTDPALLPPGLSHAAPTRAGIRQAMALAAKASLPGDTVLFYFSGHGTQAPDMDGDEPGGRDEVLLPMDAGRWNGAAGEVENAISDDELQAWARGLLGRGVQVVGIIDACHSGTGFRAGPGAGAARVVDPALLGIPDGVQAAPAERPPLTGDHVFLYSSQADQRSYEYPLDPASPGGRWQGAFTLALARALQQGDGASWGQVLAAARMTMQRGAQAQDPDGEGTLLDRAVFGRGAPVDRFPVVGGQVMAGLLRGVAAGDEVSLFGQPAGGDSLGRALLADVGPGTAQLDPPPPPAAAWAEVIRPAPLPPLRLARLARADGGDPGPWPAALEAAVAEGLAVWSDGASDLVPVLTGGGIALAGPDGVLDPQGPGSTPRITPAPGEDTTAATLRVIERAAHALRFRDVMAGLAGARPGKAAVGMEIERRPAAPDGEGCGTAAPGGPLDGATVAPCDELWLTLANRSGQDQDVTVFYLTQDFTLAPLWPANGLSNRLAPGETARTGLQITPGTAPNAVEDILVVAVEAVPGAGRADLARLATPERLRGRFAGVHPETDAIENLLSPDARPRGFSAARPVLSYLRQTLHVTGPTR